MHVLSVRNVHDALPELLSAMAQNHLIRETRNGPARVMISPVTTVYSKPCERVMFWPLRDANPFLHLFESLWMLNGRADIAWPCRFAKNIANYSDDGKVLRGAYGQRWRSWFGRDQLDDLVGLLKKQPHSRRAFLGIWDPRADLLVDEGTTKDVPCNLGMHFEILPSGLQATLLCRSNDAVWGAYGANAVHFSYLQEYLATRLQMPAGRFYQISIDMHVYEDWWRKLQSLQEMAKDPFRTTVHNPYETEEVSPFPLMSVPPGRWELELQLFMEDPLSVGFEDPFFSKVAKPMYAAHAAWKSGLGISKFSNAIDLASRVEASDWRKAAVEWLARRREIYLATV